MEDSSSESTQTGDGGSQRSPAVQTGREGTGLGLSTDNSRSPWSKNSLRVWQFQISEGPALAEQQDQTDADAPPLLTA